MIDISAERKSADGKSGQLQGNFSREQPIIMVLLLLLLSSSSLLL